MDNRPIGIFDSGAGGLSSVRELALEAPGESLVFLGDTLRAPYGGRPTEELKALSLRNARFLRAQNVKAILVSCNTSTASALAELLADNGDIPLVGTVAPTAAEAVRRSASGRIGVMATEATVRSGLYERTIRALRPEAQVTSRSCPKLVPLIEAGRTAPEDTALRAALAEDTAPLRAAEVDTVVLGCTHYPLIREAIRRALGFEAVFVDSGAACVGTLLAALAARDSLAAPGTARSEQFYCTGRREEFLTVARGFLGRDIALSTKQVDIEGY